MFAFGGSVSAVDVTAVPVSSESNLVNSSESVAKSRKSFCTDADRFEILPRWSNLLLEATARSKPRSSS